MSADRAISAADIDARRKGLRIALAVAVAFCWSVFSGTIIPFLGPLFAAQLLQNPRPVPLKTAVVTALMVVLTGALLQAVTLLTGHRPPILVLLLGLIYFACFFLQVSGKGGGAIFLIIVVAVMVPLLTILNPEVGDAMLSILVQGVVSGTLFSWLAHAVIPNRSLSDPAPPPAAPPNPDATRFAAANTAILLIAVVACLTRDGLATAIVIPITVASLLSQFDVGASARASFGLVLANLLGGVVASVAFAILQVRPTPVSLFLIVLFVGLMLAGRAALDSRSARLFSGALTIFLIVFGTGVSPLPGSAAESFSTRISFVTFAAIYTVFMGMLLWPRSNRADVAASP